MANLEGHIRGEYEDKVRRGTAATNLGHVDPGHSDRDSSKGAGWRGDGEVREANSAESSHAKRGQADATRGYQMPGPFTPSNGLHSVGSDHVGVFARSVNMAGGVRQGHTFTSDPASGIARAPIANNHAYDWIKVQGQRSGDTFEMRQHRRWAGRGG